MQTFIEPLEYRPLETIVVRSQETVLTRNETDGAIPRREIETAKTGRYMSFLLKLAKALRNSKSRNDQTYSSDIDAHPEQPHPRVRTFVLR